MIRLAIAALLLAAAGCPGDPSCPEGSVSVEGRCVYGGDAAADAAAGADGGLPGDACAPSSHYRDEDGDGFGAGEPTVACDPPPGTAEVGGDCDDGDPAVHPGAAERCNGVDDDCDGERDEGLPPAVGEGRVLAEDGSLHATGVSVVPHGDGYAVVYVLEARVQLAGVDADGAPTVAPAAVDPDGGGEQARPVATATSDGGLLIVWEQRSAGATALVRARRLGPDLDGPAARTLTTEAGVSDGAGPAVAAVDGLVVVTWARSDLRGVDGIVLSDADLEPTGAELPLLDLMRPEAMALVPVAAPRPPFVLLAVSAASPPVRLARLRVRPLAVDGPVVVLFDGLGAGIAGALHAEAEGGPQAAFTVAAADELSLVTVAAGAAGGGVGSPMAAPLAPPGVAASGGTAIAALPDGLTDVLAVTGSGEGLWWARLSTDGAVGTELLGPGESATVVSLARMDGERALVASATEDGRLWVAPLGCVR